MWPWSIVRKQKEMIETLKKTLDSQIKTSDNWQSVWEKSQDELATERALRGEAWTLVSEHEATISVLKSELEHWKPKVIPTFGPGLYAAKIRPQSKREPGEDVVLLFDATSKNDARTKLQALKPHGDWNVIAFGKSDKGENGEKSIGPSITIR